MLTRKEIIKAIHNGSWTANKKYEKWSHGETILDSGVEGLLVASIAEALHDAQEGHESLLLEVPFRYIQEWSGAKRPRGRPPGMLGGGNRMDIVLFNRFDRPICAIEVKRGWSRGQCFRDLERLRKLVVACAHIRKGSLRRGFLTVFLKDTSVKQRMDDIRGIVQETFPHKGMNIRFHQSKIQKRKYDDKSLELASLCIEISSRNN